MSSDNVINKINVGRIAERIVANELEYRGFRVSDLNKEGLSANADLIAAKNGKTIQIQVKGSSWENGYWFGYGYAKQETIDKEQEVFNCSAKFYKASLLVLACVKTPSEYQCLVLPINVGETAAQLNLERDFRIRRADEENKRPGKMWISIDDDKRKFRNIAKGPLYLKEQNLLKPYLNKWDEADTLLHSEDHLGLLNS